MVLAEVGTQVCILLAAEYGGLAAQPAHSHPQANTGVKILWAGVYLRGSPSSLLPGLSSLGVGPTTATTKQL